MSSRAGEYVTSRPEDCRRVGGIFVHGEPHSVVQQYATRHCVRVGVLREKLRYPVRWRGSQSASGAGSESENKTRRMNNKEDGCDKASARRGGEHARAESFLGGYPQLAP
ncbi:unnamed protein product [Boreogadus saida]